MFCTENDGPLPLSHVQAHHIPSKLEQAFYYIGGRKTACQPFPDLDSCHSDTLMSMGKLRLGKALVVREWI